MTTTAKVLAELDRLTSNETPPNAVEIATWFALRLPILRAALAPPQEGEVEECAARVREWLPIVEDRDLTIAEFHAMQLKIARDVRSLLRATQAQSLTDAQIVEIRDDHLPSQGEPFDCIAFARAILNASSHEHVYCPHCRPCKHSERVDAYDGVLRGLASYLSAGGFNSTGLIDPEVADAKIRWGIDNFVKVEVDRLLRATQNNGHSPEVRSALEPTGKDLDHSPTAQAGYGGLENGNRHQTVPAGESPAQSAPAPTKQRRIDNLLRIADDDSVNNFARSICGEAARFLSTQSAPAQEPVAWRVKDFADGWILVHTWPEAMAEAESAGNTIQPLYAAPPPDEARELLETAKHELIWCSERRHEARVNALVERIRAYLEKHK